MTSERFRRVAWLTGVAATIVTHGSILLATRKSSSFGWADGTLSELGVEPGVAWLFNGGLVVGAVLMAPYAVALRTHGPERASRVRAGGFTLAAVSMGGVGVFPVGRPLHDPLAIAFFLASAATLLTDGLDRRRTPSGAVTLGAGLLIPVAWVLWAVTGLGTGIAVPEYVGLLLFGGWVVALSPICPWAFDT